MDIPQYMKINQFCTYCGISRWNFQRIREQYQLPVYPRGLEVESTIKVRWRQGCGWNCRSAGSENLKITFQAARSIV